MTNACCVQSLFSILLLWSRFIVSLVRKDKERTVQQTYFEFDGKHICNPYFCLHVLTSFVPFFIQPVFQRHRLNSNLIAIVPMSNEPSPRSDTSPNQKTERAMLVATSTGPKLELPQHRYCKVETDQENKGGGPVGKYL